MSPWSCTGTAHQAASVHAGLCFRCVCVWGLQDKCASDMAETTVNVSRMACVSKSQTVAVMLIDSSTNQETMSSQTAGTGRDWFNGFQRGFSSKDSCIIPVGLHVLVNVQLAGWWTAPRPTVMVGLNLCHLTFFYTFFYTSYAIRGDLADSEHVFLPFPVILQDLSISSNLRWIMFQCHF